MGFQQGLSGTLEVKKPGKEENEVNEEEKRRRVRMIED